MPTAVWDPDRAGGRPVSDGDVAATGTAVHPSGHGPVEVSRLAATGGTAGRWATDGLTRGDPARLRPADPGRRVEGYRCGVRQVDERRGRRR